MRKLACLLAVFGLSSCCWLSTLTADLLYKSDHAKGEYKAGRLSKDKALRCARQVVTEIKRAENGLSLITQRTADAALARADMECENGSSR